MRIMQEFLKWFVYITTGVLFVCAVIYTFFSKEEMIPSETLWQILLAGVLTSLVTTVFEKFLMAAEMVKHLYVVGVLHYASLCACMVACGLVFGWVELQPGSMVQMCLFVAVVYLFVVAVDYILGRQLAEKINRKLKETYRGKE